MVCQAGGHSTSWRVDLESTARKTGAVPVLAVKNLGVAVVPRLEPLHRFGCIARQKTTLIGGYEAWLCY